MTKNVIITLQGFHDRQDAEGDPVEIVTGGKYFRKNDQHYLVFEEAVEGFEEKTRSIFKFSDRRLMVHRSGLINSEMLFEPDRRVVTSYDTPMGRMLIGISATSLSLKEEETRISCGVDYTMSINDGSAEDCHIQISVQPRETWSIGSMDNP